MPDLSTYEAEKIASGLRFVDGLAWSRSGYLALADVRQQKIFKVSSTPHPEVMRENSGGASGLAWDAQGRLYICESEARRVTRMNAKGEVEVLVAEYQGKKLNSPNDIAVRKDGHVYFTDPAFGSADDRRELMYHGIWHLGPKGSAEPVAMWQTRPNGITLSADGKLLFVSDSDRHAVAAFDLDHNGQATNQRDVIKGIAGVPGGMTTDSSGRFFIATKGVAVYSTAGKLETTLLESEYTSNCTFGGADLDDLFVSSRGSVFRVNMSVRGALQY